MLDATGIRALRRAPIFETPPVLPPPAAGRDEPAELSTARKCYVCKATFTQVHHFYDQMCPPCAALNWERRFQTADLSGRVALVTGARVKIGYQAAIKLLRAGARVIVTTRFPHDARGRYARERDHADWQHRLHIHGLDLRHTPSVEAFCHHVDQTFDRLDFILNNACQTVRRPPGFYRHLMEVEDAASVPLFGAADGQIRPAEELREQIDLFVRGELDQDLQAIDRREINSWRLRLDEVPTVELLEVQLVNAIAPYVLNARLRGLMRRSPERDKHIVNVSAMEGQFYRAFKTDRHPHTNMAKAALNMMTRTSAVGLRGKDGIHMNSVDTGWVTDEDPIEIARAQDARARLSRRRSTSSTARRASSIRSSPASTRASTRSGSSSRTTARSRGDKLT